MKLHYEGLDELDQPVGKHPDNLTVSELNTLGHVKKPLLRIIRENCLECAGNSQAEVRRCAAIKCPFWPYRMASNPFYGEK